MTAEPATAIIDACLALNRSGINQGTSGNVSMRAGSGFLISPSGMTYESLTPDDIVAMDLSGQPAPGARRPSSEWRFHLDLYRERDDVMAIVHAHPRHCTALACHGLGIPPFHYMVAVAGGRDIRCAPYATFGSQALSDAVVQAMSGRRACLLGNHGLIAVGPTLDKALALAMEVEALAAQYIFARVLGEPRQLDDEEMERVLEKFRHYGDQAQNAQVADT
jgi:L-fuculose-phosphate aldolase